MNRKDYLDHLAHHGIKGQKWGTLNGPPYPLTDLQRSSKENKLNSTSPTARHLSAVGNNNRFNQAARNVSDTGSGGGGGSSSSKKSSSSSSTTERKEGHTYHDSLTREARFEMLKKKNPDQYTKKDLTTKTEEKEEKTSTKKTSTAKASTKSSKSDAEKQKEAEEKARAAAEKAAKQEREQWVKDAKKAVDNTFNDDISTRSFKDLLDEFYNGAFAKNFLGEEDPDFDDITFEDEDGNEIELSEGDKFYLKLMSRFDSSTKNYDEYISRMLDIFNDTESTSLSKLSAAISVLTDYADELEKSNRSSEDIKAYTQILGYLDNKLRWYNELGSTKTSGKRTYRAYETQQEIEEFLKNAGF